MAIQQFQAKVSEMTKIGTTYIQFHFELSEPKNIRFQPGQYLLLNVPGTAQKKSYSITSSKDLDHAIEIVVNTAPQGEGTKYLQSLKPGDGVSFFAPAGVFSVAPQSSQVGQQEKALVFVATGSGIAPVKSMIIQQLRFENDARPIVLHWGLRYEEDLFWLDKFQDLAQAYPNFQLHLVLSKATPAWKLCRGRVTDCLQVHPLVHSAGYYICGHTTMVEDVKNLLMQKGVAQEHIHHEKFF